MKRLIKILIIIICAISICTLSGCKFNKQLFDFQYEFNYWYDYNLNETFEIEKWTDYDGEQLQLTLTDGTVILVNSMNGILYSSSDNDKFEK